MAGQLLFPTINNVILSGRLTRDLELRYTPNGSAVLNFSLACDRFYTDSNGQRQQIASFVDVVVWGKLAENSAKFLSKGSPIIVEGYLQTRSYKDRNDNNRKVTEVVASRVNFLEKSNNFQPSNSRPNNQSNTTNNNQPKNNYQSNEITEDDVPF